jgi:hypothetical protein
MHRRLNANKLTTIPPALGSLSLLQHLCVAPSARIHHLDSPSPTGTAGHRQRARVLTQSCALTPATCRDLSFNQLQGVIPTEMLGCQLLHTLCALRLFPSLRKRIASRSQLS